MVSELKVIKKVGGTQGVQSEMISDTWLLYRTLRCVESANQLVVDVLSKVEDLSSAVRQIVKVSILMYDSSYILSTRQ